MIAITTPDIILESQALVDIQTKLSYLTPDARHRVILYLQGYLNEEYAFVLEGTFGLTKTVVRPHSQHVIMEKMK